MREYVAPVARKPLSRQQRAQRFLQAGGRCQKCLGVIKRGEFEVDHDISLKSGGSNSPDNLFVLCWPCHGTKTAKRDAPKHAKIDRLHIREAGIKPKSRLTHPKLVRGFDGVVRERR